MRFIRQYSAGPYVLDFYCPKLKLAIELDGGQYAQDDNQDYDAARSAYLKSQGIDVIRFWNHEVLQATENVLAMMAQKNSPSPSYAKRGDRRGEKANWHK